MDFFSRRDIDSDLELKDSDGNLMIFTRVYVYSSNGTYYGSVVSSVDGIIDISLVVPSYEVSLELHFTSYLGHEIYSFIIP